MTNPNEKRVIRTGLTILTMLLAGALATGLTFTVARVAPRLRLGDVMGDQSSFVAPPEVEPAIPMLPDEPAPITHVTRARAHELVSVLPGAAASHDLVSPRDPLVDGICERDDLQMGTAGSSVRYCHF